MDKKIPFGKAFVGAIALNEGTNGYLQDIAEVAWEALIYRDNLAKEKVKNALYLGGKYVIQNPIDAGIATGISAAVGQLCRKALRAFGLRRIDLIDGYWIEV